MRILITGGKGMLGRTLQHALSEHDLFVADLPETDILSPDSLAQAFAAFKPDVVIHCAAMTKVDDCETKRELAFRLNGTGSANVAFACCQHHARLIAISTDYVFSGERESGAWSEVDTPCPKTVYGRSKLAGEQSVLETLPNAVVLRIAWLYGAGGPSFVHTMVKLGRQQGVPLKVVDDQRGNPTSTQAVADEIKFLLAHPEITGVVHGTCAGETTWYGFTQEIFAQLQSFPNPPHRALVPCTTAEFPRPAPRPANSALAKTVLERAGYTPQPWREALHAFLSSEAL